MITKVPKGYHDWRDKTEVSFLLEIPDVLTAVSTWKIVDVESGENVGLSFSQSDPQRDSKEIVPSSDKQNHVTLFAHGISGLNHFKNTIVKFSIEVYTGFRQDNLEEKREYKLVFLRRDGTHYIAIDFGTSGSCIAIKSTDWDEHRTQLQILDFSNQSPTSVFPSGVFLTAHQKLISTDAASFEATKLRTISEKRASIGVGSKALALGIIRAPDDLIKSLKKIVNQKTSYWQNFDLEPQSYDDAPAQVLSAFLRHTFKKMLVINKTWHTPQMPLPHKVVVTVPNGSPYSMIARVKNAVCKSLNSVWDEAYKSSDMSLNPLAKEWVIDPEDIEVMGEAEATAAEYIYRKGGLLEDITKNKPEHIAVFDLGAGTIDAVLMDYTRKTSMVNDQEITTAAVDTHSKFGWDVAGDDLDSIFARALMDALIDDAEAVGGGSIVVNEKEKQSLLSTFSSAMAIPFFGHAAMEDSDNDNFMRKLVDEIGFFHRYKALLEENQISSSSEADVLEAMGVLQSARVQLSNYSQQLKVAVANYYYSEPVELQGVSFKEDLNGEPRGKNILQEMYEVFSNGQTLMEKRDKMAELYGEAVTAFSNIKLTCTPELRFLDGGQIALNMSRVYNDTEFLRNFLERVGQQFVQHLFEGWEYNGEDELHIVIAGRLAKFPLIQETILFTLAADYETRFMNVESDPPLTSYACNFPDIANIKFANKDDKPDALKNKVVCGACDAIKHGQELSNDNLRAFENYCIIVWNQENGSEMVRKVISRGSLFDKQDKNGLRYLEGTLSGVRLRPAAGAQDSVRLYELEQDDIDIAKSYKDNFYRMRLLYNTSIAKAGSFDMDSDKTITMRLFADGRSELIVTSERDGESVLLKSESSVEENLLTSDDPDELKHIQNRYFPV